MCCSRRPEPQQVEAPLPGGLKAGVQGLAGVAALLQPLPPQPDDHPLIGRRRVDDRAVDHIVLHQQQVPGLEEVGDALHHVGHLPPQHQDELVKFVIMVIQLLGAAVFQVEQAEILVQISPLAHFAAVQHRSTPSFISAAPILSHFLPFLNQNFIQMIQNFCGTFGGSVESGIEFRQIFGYTPSARFGIL